MEGKTEAVAASLTLDTEPYYIVCHHHSLQFTPSGAASPRAASTAGAVSVF